MLKVLGQRALILSIFLGQYPLDSVESTDVEMYESIFNDFSEEYALTKVKGANQDLNVYFYDRETHLLLRKLCYKEGVFENEIVYSYDEADKPIDEQEFSKNEIQGETEEAVIPKSHCFIGPRGRRGPVGSRGPEGNTTNEGLEATGAATVDVSASLTMVRVL
jgi:hypothetical protein